MFGVIGLILGIAGMKKTGQPHVTGKGLGVGALIPSVLGLLLSIALTAGVTTFLTDENQLGVPSRGR